LVRTWKYGILKVSIFVTVFGKYQLVKKVFKIPKYKILKVEYLKYQIQMYFSILNTILNTCI